MKWPFVSRKKVEIAQSVTNEYISKNGKLLNEINHIKNELSERDKVVKEVLPRLFNIDIRSSRDFKTYRVCVNFHRDMVERAFTHGDDDRTIRYFATMLAKEIEYKMIHFNFARCDR